MRFKEFLDAYYKFILRTVDLPRWKKLTLYRSFGKLEIDKNFAQNSIRHIDIGRKNYLFAGLHEAAQNAAQFYSLLRTCKLKGIEPFE